MHLVNIRDKILLVQGSKTVVRIRRGIKETNHSFMLDTDAAGVKYAVFNIFIPEPFTDIIEGFPLPLQISRI